jgi:DNA-binding NarL/FixJ family response regulator
MQPPKRLSRREAEIAELVWQGLTNREISRAIGTTEAVVKNNLREVFDKLGVWSRLEFAIYIATHGGANWQEAFATHAEDVMDGEPVV